jgi:hypothetical protein
MASCAWDYQWDGTPLFVSSLAVVCSLHVLSMHVTRRYNNCGTDCASLSYMFITERHVVTSNIMLITSAT